MFGKVVKWYKSRENRFDKKLCFCALFFICSIIINIANNSKINLSFSINNTTGIEYQIFYTTSQHNEFSEQNSLRQWSGKGQQKLYFELPVWRLTKLRIDFGNNPDKVTIFPIKIDGSSQKILSDFSKFKALDIAEYKNHGETLEIISHNADPQIIYDEPLQIYGKLHINKFWLLISLLFWCSIYLFMRWEKIKYLLLYTPLFLIYAMHYFALFPKAAAKYNNIYSWRLVCDCLSANSLIVAIFAALLFLYFMGKFWRIPVMICSTVFTVVLLIDYVVIDNLDARFIFSEIATQGQEFGTAWEMLKKYMATFQGLLSLLFILNVIYIFVRFKQTSQKIAFSFCTIMILAIISMHIMWDKGIFRYAYYNVIDVNFKNHQAVRHSKNNIKKIQSFVFPQKCVKGLNKQKNVILIIAESLSSYKIKSFNGLEDKMPKFDALTQKGWAFKNFYGNSYNTTGGIFSVLTGKNMIHGYVSLGNYRCQSYYNETLPKRLAKSGYFTKFFTGVNLAHGMDDLLQNLGFAEISNSNDQFYKGHERIIFNSVSDDILFDNVIAQLSTKADAKPFLYVVSTISTHGPFIDPITKKRSFDKTLTFLDNEIAEFVEKLRKLNFFADGLLMVTADHRAMLPVTNTEYEKYGVFADGAIPLLIFDDGRNFLPKQENSLFSQTDITPSLEYYLTEKGCFNQFQRNLFLPKYHADVCVIRSYLSPKDKVGIYCPTGKYADVYLNGDDTSISDSSLSSYKDYILYLRTKSLSK